MINAHRIRRQVWNVRVTSAFQVAEASERVRELMEGSWLSDLARRWDETLPEDVLIRIPRLEVRLGTLDSAALQSVLTEAVSTRVAEHLSGGVGLKQGALAVLMDPDVIQLDVLLRYLREGALPWFVSQRDVKSILQTLSSMAESRLAWLATECMPAHIGDVSSYFYRLLQLLPETRWIEVIEAVVRVTGTGGIRDGLSTGAQANRSARSTTMTEAALVLTSGAPRHSTLSALAQRLARWVQGLSRPSDTAQSAGAPSVIAGEGDIPGEIRPVNNLPAVTIADPVPDPRFDAMPEHSAPMPAEADRWRASAAPLGLNVRHAGLVLLHPFLPTLFQALGHGRCREGVLDPDELPRAAALLHWLATGADEAYEFELPLIKVLLGLEPRVALNVGAGLLGDRDREEGQEVLAACVRHWTALRETSVEGLRVAFLQRGGLLHDEEAQWRLSVEPESFDLLLNQLPWALSTVKLPWMTRPLFTHWPSA